MTASHLRVIYLAATSVALFGCQGVQPGTGTPATLESNFESSPETFEGSRGALDVRLEAVDEIRPEALLQRRNPFRFGLSSFEAATDAERGTSHIATPTPVSSDPRAPPTGSLVRLRMIGLVEGSETVGRIAVLTDGNVVFHGRAGDIVEGRYLLLAVEPTSVELESLHNGNRQIISLASR